MLLVRRSTVKKVKFGQVVVCVGSHPRLGGWDLGAAPAMRWGPGDCWALQVQLPPLLVVDFKLAVRNMGPPVWQQGPDRKVALPCVGEGPMGTGAVEVEVPWEGAPAHLLGESAFCEPRPQSAPSQPIATLL